jgi:hypothetical protein
MLGIIVIAKTKTSHDSHRGLSFFDMTHKPVQKCPDYAINEGKVILK